MSTTRDEPGPTASAGNTTPTTLVLDPDRLAEALDKLRVQFQLTEQQLAALPTLSDISLIPQHDSHLIVAAAGGRFAHPFKLFVGEVEWKMEKKEGRDSAYVYLFHGRGTQMKMEICSPDADGHWGPIDMTYFGDVTHLAYPFNEWLGHARFSAAVKFYFMLGREAGLFTADPGFQFSKSWARDLQGACDDLIEANKLEETTTNNQAVRNQAPPSSSMNRNMKNKRNEEPGTEQRRARKTFKRRPPANQSAEDVYDVDSGTAIPLPAYRSLPLTYPVAPLAPPGSLPPPAYHHPTYRSELGHSQPSDISKDRTGFSRTQSSLRKRYSTTYDDEESDEHPSLRRSYEGKKPASQQRLSEYSGSKYLATSFRPRTKSDTSTSAYQRAVSSVKEKRRKVRKEYVSLEDEFVDLYRRRDEIQERLNEIKGELSEEEYRALVVRIERPQLATLMMPSDLRRLGQ
ncbi:Nn.00g065950.m01.CDS01 [Neocucurbitaria sp. VM-36]